MPQAFFIGVCLVQKTAGGRRKWKTGSNTYVKAVLHMTREFLDVSPGSHPGPVSNNSPFFEPMCNRLVVLSADGREALTFNTSLETTATALLSVCQQV